MVFEELTICPKGFLKVLNLMMTGAGALCIGLSNVTDDAVGGIGYFETYTSAVTVALICSILMILFVGFAGYTCDRLHRFVGVFYLLLGIFIAVGVGVAFPILEELNAKLQALKDKYGPNSEKAVVPGYWEFIASMLLSSCAVMSHGCLSLLHWVNRKDDEDQISSIN